MKENISNALEFRERELFRDEPALLIRKDELDLDYYGDDDDDDDELESGINANTRKSLAPMFIYKIITYDIRAGRRITQKEIIKRLEDYPYCVKLGRQAVGRILHSLVDFDCRINCKKDGVVFEPDSVWGADSGSCRLAA